jgi:acetylornithine deacetylase
VPAAADIDDAGKQLIDLLGELVAFPTESRTPNIGLIRWVAEQLEATDGRTTVIEGEQGRANLLASFGPRAMGGLLLSGHTDVVPAGTGWATDPYAVTPVGDTMYGRGTADMKGFIAASMRTAEAVRETELKKPLHILLSFDEEIGCVGVRHALAAISGSEDVRPELVVIGEPTMMRPRHSHLGKVAFQIICTAQAAHSSLSHTEPSASSSAVRLLSVIDELQQKYAPTGDAEVTFNCGSISGGSALNVIAERCAFAFEIRHTVDHDPDAVLQPFRDAVDRERQQLLAHGGDIDVTETIRYPALRTPADDQWLQVVERIADAGPSAPLGFGTEGGLFADALGASIVICGPGDIAVAHRPDEYVTLDQLLRCERFLRTLVDQICVHPAAES